MATGQQQQGQQQGQQQTDRVHGQDTAKPDTAKPGHSTQVANRYGEPQGQPQGQPGIADQLMLEREKASNSFGLIFNVAQEAARFWKDRATVTSAPSPDWKDILLAIGEVAFGQIVSGIAKRAASGFSGEVMRTVADTTMNGVGDQLSSLTKSAIQDALASGGDDKHAALLAFCYLQITAMMQAEYAAKNTFLETAVGLSVDDLRQIRATNEAAAQSGVANAVVEREMLAAWMQMLGGGKDVIGSADKNELGNRGTLGLEIVGKNSRPDHISRARAVGLGPKILRTLEGKHVSYFYGQEGKGGLTGLNIVMMTRQNDYFMSPSHHEALLRAGVWGDDARGWQKQQREEEAKRGLVSEKWAEHAHEEARIIPERAADLGSINFGIGRRIDGSFEYISDFGGWYMDDKCAGYTAGRYFLENITSPAELFAAIGRLTISKGIMEG